MRIVKQRLLEQIPDLAVFLDVDDLHEGRGAEYVLSSEHILIFLSQGYFQSPNCMRELLCAVFEGKPLITLLEPDTKHGGLRRDEVPDMTTTHTHSARNPCAHEHHAPYMHSALDGLSGECPAPCPSATRYPSNYGTLTGSTTTLGATRILPKRCAGGSRMRARRVPGSSASAQARSCDCREASGRTARR